MHDSFRVSRGAAGAGALVRLTGGGLLALLLVALAALGTAGWRIPAICASIAAGAWAVSCVLAPETAAGSEGHVWAWAVIVWAAVTATATLWPRTRERVIASAALAPGA